MNELFEFGLVPIEQASCAACGLYKGCKTPRMKPTGKGRKRILVIAEAPGKTEDARGVQLVGQAGQLLRNILHELGIDLDRDCWKTNAVACRPPNNRPPSLKEIGLCRPRIEQAIKELKPEKIIVLGGIAMQSILDGRFSYEGIGRWVGWKIPDQKWGRWIFPTYHPSYLLRNENDKNLERIFIEHLETAIKWDKMFSDEVLVSDLFDLNEAKLWLKSLRKPSTISIDFETTGIKPHTKGHKIICVGMSSGKYEGVAFPLFEDKEFRDMLQRTLLRNNSIYKVAHNLKFEDTWARVILGYPIKNWLHDTMIGAHILDNRKGICSLKFQVYVNYGMVYGKEIEPFLKAKGANEINKIDKAPLKQLLNYCAMDAYFTRKLYHDQVGALADTGKGWGYKLFHDGVLAFSDIEANGAKVDEYYYKGQSFILDEEEKKIENEITKIGGKEFNPNSSKQLTDLFFNKKGIKPTKFTDKKNISVDEEVLKSLAKTEPLAEKILRLRKLHKLKGTYVKGFITEAVEGTMRPSFNLHTVRTYRSSSSNPNFQNIPMRDEEAQRITRSGIIPSKGNLLLEVDYSGIEVRIACCYHKDPAMIKYIEDPKSDLHRDMAAELYMLNKSDVTPSLRGLAKGHFVFAEFYGDYYEQIAPALWEGIEGEKTVNGISVKRRLQQKGINTYRDFVNHVK